jgi:hypothetical protein
VDAARRRAIVAGGEIAAESHAARAARGMEPAGESAGEETTWEIWRLGTRGRSYVLESIDRSGSLPSMTENRCLDE